MCVSRAGRDAEWGVESGVRRDLVPRGAVGVLGLVRVRLSEGDRPSQKKEEEAPCEFNRSNGPISRQSGQAASSKQQLRAPGRAPTKRAMNQKRTRAVASSPSCHLRWWRPAWPAPAPRRPCSQARAPCPAIGSGSGSSAVPVHRAEVEREDKREGRGEKREKRDACIQGSVVSDVSMERWVGRGNVDYDDPNRLSSSDTIQHLIIRGALNYASARVCAAAGDDREGAAGC